ncbi:hypothetical protein QN399_23635, partial [Pseudomonas sp. 10C3]|uniref:hypothetical protein n=1 Tax=Pseudomonas sp. 10C3 TaxID=3118753 RepID=UPI002E82183B
MQVQALDASGLKLFDGRRKQLLSPIFLAHKQNPCLRKQTGVSEFNLDDDLLSHGETPHYHRRCIVSLLSS